MYLVDCASYCYFRVFYFHLKKKKAYWKTVGCVVPAAASSVFCFHIPDHIKRPCLVTDVGCLGLCKCTLGCSYTMSPNNLSHRACLIMERWVAVVKIVLSVGTTLICNRWQPVVASALGTGLLTARAGWLCPELPAVPVVSKGQVGVLSPPSFWSPG